MSFKENDPQNIPLETHILRMREALTLARSVEYRTSPNPTVGCVIYSPSGQRLSQGVTAPLGGPHAEATAITNARLAGYSLEDALVYVTLEPCAHHGRTPPCVESLISAHVGHVLIGTLDPNPLVSGRGVARLTKRGVTVTQELCADECQALHAPFKKWISSGRPWVTLKGAMTLDGCLATAQGHSKWITGIESRTRAHELRAKVDAVMVGGETARLDRPSLNVRLCEGDDPTPVILSRTLALPRDLPCGRSGAIFVHGPEAPQKIRENWTSRGVTLIEVPLTTSGGLDLSMTLDALGALNLTHLLVEGGGKLHGALLEEGLADDLHLFIAPKIIGRGRPLFHMPSVDQVPNGWKVIDTQTSQLGDDFHLYGRIFRSQLNDDPSSDSGKG